MIVATDVIYIGKEANRWEEQWHLGFDPTAGIIYGMAPKDLSHSAKSVIREARQFSRRALSQARLSLSQLSRILCGRVKPTKKALVKIKAGIEILCEMPLFEFAGERFYCGVISTQAKVEIHLQVIEGSRRGLKAP